MYSTKQIHKNVCDSYITISDPYDKAAKEKNPRWNGKQFSTIFPKSGSIPKQVCYEKMTFGPHGKYNAEPLYITTQPLDKRKLGFGSHDASRRDEFSNPVRTTQHCGAIDAEKNTMQRQMLKGQAPNPSKLQAVYQSKIDELESQVAEVENKIGMTQRIAREQAERRVGVAEHLYDIGRNSNTEFNPKMSRDQFYAPSKTTPVSYGYEHTTSLRHGMQEGCETKIDKKAQFVCVHSTEAFYDNTHLGIQ